MSLLCFFAHTFERISNFRGQWRARGKFAQVFVRKCHNRVGLIFVWACAGCAAAPATALTDAERSVSSGAMIVAARPVWQDDGSATVMQLLGRPGGRLSPSSSEFIVRTADGRLISIVQQAEPALQAGHSVTVHPGQQARLSAGP